MSDAAERAATLTFNGIDATTGGYALSNLAPGEVLDVVSRRRGKKARGPIPGLNLKSLAECGWGVIFPRHVPAAVREALEPGVAR